MNGGEMNKIFVLGVVVILSGSMVLPAVIGGEDMDEKITVRVRTSPGTISEREVSPVVGTRLQSMISQLNNHTDNYKTLLPALLDVLEDCGLIENACTFPIQYHCLIYCLNLIPP